MRVSSPAGNMRWRRFLRLMSLFLVVQLLLWNSTLPCLQNQAGAEELSFDLKSPTQSQMANLSAGQSAALVVGGRPRMVGTGSALTAAEFIALQQVLQTGRQSLVVSANGVATAGTIDISRQISVSPGTLVIPPGITAIHNASLNPLLSVAGTLTNIGTLVIVAERAIDANAVIQASNIVNSTGALISSVLPADPLFSRYFPGPVNLSLVASGAITNEGTIVSSGNLSLQAKTINNAGAIVANTGDITARALNSDLTINNQGGVFQALSGNINIQALADSVTSGIILSGGDFFSNRLVLDAGKGAIFGSVHQATGWVDVTACNSTFGATAGDLQLGAMNFSGDPTYYNTNGSLIISSLSSTAGAALALVASQDVIVQGGAIDTSNLAGGNGGSLTIISGANFTSSGPTSAGPNSSATLTITQSALPTHGSATGGAIDLSAVTSISTNGTYTPTNLGGAGGNILMVAFDGDGSGSALTPGTINAGLNGSINSFGGGANANGNVTIIAGAASNPVGGEAVNVPAIFSAWSSTYSQGGTSGGDVTIATAIPNVSSLKILNGAITGGSISPSNNIMPTSIKLGAQGGSNPIVQTLSTTNWQTLLAQHALDAINASRAANGGLPPLTLDPVASVASAKWAEYNAQTSQTGHFALNGSSPTGRIYAVSAFSYESENSGWARGRTPEAAFDLIHSLMMAEPPGVPNHRSNILDVDAESVGIGFATINGVVFMVCDFRSSPANTGSPNIPNDPVHGGVGGPAGALPVDPGATSAKSVSLIAAIDYNPVSILAGPSKVNITAGDAVTAAGSIMANGRAALLPAALLPSSKGGTVTINAGGNVSLAGIQANGAFPAYSTSAASGGDGGAGGAVSVTSSGGNIQLIPPAPCTQCLGIGVAGGAGGQSYVATGSGGKGGAGGTVSLSAPHGNITVSAIDAGGGAGAAGNGGGNAGDGGSGGAAGSIEIEAGDTVTVQYFLSASGGGGGGAGGQSANGGGGGGGGSMGMAAGGGASSGSASSGGGGGGHVPGLGGSTSIKPWYAVTSSNGQFGSAFDQTGLAGGITGGGTGGVGSGATGGSGGGLGQAGSDDSTGLSHGGAGGAGGSVSLSAKKIVLEGDVDAYWNPGGSYYTVAGGNGGASILAAGNNGQITIATESMATRLDPNGNYGIGGPAVQLELGRIFVVGSIASGNGSFGDLVAGGAGQTGTVSINGTAANSPVTSGSFAPSGPTSVSIIENLAPVIFNSGDTVTAAEYAAIVMKISSGNQGLDLDVNGVASGGFVTVTDAIAPSGGFDILSVPANVTLNANVSTLLAQQITLDGSINSSSALTLKSNEAAIPFQLVLGAGSSITATSLFIVSDANAAGLSISGQGSITAATTELVSLAGNLSLANGTQLSVTGAATLRAADPTQTITLGTGSQLTATGAVSFVTSSLDLNGAASGSHISVFNQASALNVSGVGSLTATQLTSISATTGNLTFSPGANITFSGLASLSASGAGQSIALATGVQLDVPDDLLINTTSFNLNGGTINGSYSLNSSFGAGTIANTKGDVVLPANFTFSGSSLSILASGNVMATSAVKFIDLSSKLAGGGDLLVVAGFNLYGPDATSFSTPSAGTYIIGAPSAQGGSVLLPKVAIKTGSTFAGAAGGNVTVIAHGGTENAGSIFLGSIATSASATGGTAGDVNLIGQGGINLGSITATGATGGNVSIVGSEPQVTGGPLLVTGGILFGPGQFTAAPTSINNGAAVKITNGINTSSSSQHAGSVTIAADSQIEIKKDIVATGVIGALPNLPAAGDISITSLMSRIKLANIKAYALPSALPQAGHGGAVNISAASLIELTGSIIVNGGNTTGGGAAGNGGNVTLSTRSFLVALTTNYMGSIKVTGYIDARGGNSVTGAPGTGGDVALSAATVVVSGAKAGASIITSDGMQGTATPAAGGDIAINTFALQSFPYTLDLTSTTANISVLPGGFFTVGSASPVNGVGGKLVSGAVVVAKTNFSTNAAGGCVICVDVTGGSTIQTITLSDSTTRDFTPFNASTGKRNVATPAQAVALFQLSRGLPQTMAVLPTGQAASATGAFTNVIDIDEFDVDAQAFTAFKLPATVTLNIHGARPTLNLPSTIVLQGVLSFPDPTPVAPNVAIAFVNLGAAKLDIATSGGITAASTLVLSGTGGSWTNNGTLTAQTLVLARPGTGTLSFVSGTNATTTATNGVLLAPTIDSAIKINFVANGTASYSLPVIFGSFSVPTIYAANAEANALKLPSTLPATQLTFALAQNIGSGVAPILVPITNQTVGGSLSSSLITISTATAAIKAKSTTGVTTTTSIQTPITIDTGAVLISSKDLKITSASLVTIDDNVQLTAGTLKASAPSWESSTLLATTDILYKGTIAIACTGIGGIAVGDDNSWISNGNALTTTNTVAGLSLGDSNLFRAMGGNIVMLAKGTIVGGSANRFQAKGTTAGSGGIELGSGVSTGTLTAAFSKPAGTMPDGSLGSGVTVSNDHGVILVNPAANQGSLSIPLSTLTLSRGAIVFDIAGPASAIQLQGTLFQTKAAKPVAAPSAPVAQADFIVDTEDL